MCIICVCYTGLTPEEAKEKPFIASMGIYVFKKQVLIDLLTEVCALLERLAPLVACKGRTDVCVTV